VTQVLNKNIGHIAVAIIRFRVYILIVLAVVTIACASQIRKLVLYNELDIWIDPESEAYTYYIQFVEDFGMDESIVVLYHSDSLSTNAHALLNYQLTDSLRRIPGVRNVFSLAGIQVPSGMLIGPQSVPLLPKHTSRPENIRIKVLQYRTYHDFLISKDFKTTSFIVIPDSSAINREVLEDVVAMAGKYLTEQGEFVMYGFIPLKEALNQLSGIQTKRFLLASALIILLLSYAFFRSIREAALPLCIAVITICWTLGLMTVTGASFNVVISAMPLILLVVGVANAIHFISGQLAVSKTNKNNREAVVRNFTDKFKKCFFSSLTTATALLSFTLSSLVPLKNFGLFAAFGVMISFVLCFLLLPIIYFYYDIDPGKRRPASDLFFRHLHLSSFLMKHKWVVYIISMVILIVSALGITRLHVNTDQITYFRKHHPIRMATEKAREWFSGVVPFELIFQLDTSIYESSASLLKNMLILDDRLDKFPEVKSMQSLPTLLEDYGMSGTREVAMTRFLQPHIVESTGLSYFISADGTLIRTTLRTEWINDTEAIELIGRLGATIGSVFDTTGVKWYFTGSAPIFAYMGNNLVKSQVRSFIFTFVVILCLFLLLFKNIRIALICMIPNILPVAATLGMMGYLNISLDVTTVLIAAVSFGIAVDDTIHFVSTYLEFRRENSKCTSVDRAMLSVGRPLIITTMLFAGGFIIMVFSGYRPLVFFGVFVTANILLALVFDLIVLPAILLYRK
jgi:uncharacterized protein